MLPCWSCVAPTDTLGKRAQLWNGAACALWIRTLTIVGLLVHCLAVHHHRSEYPASLRADVARILHPRGRFPMGKSQINIKAIMSSPSTRNITSQVGHTVYLHCIIDDLGDRAVSWIRLRDFHLLTVGLYTYTSDDRFQPIHSEYGNDWALQIKFAQSKDAGLYECQVNSDPPRSRYINLHIVVPKAKILGTSELYVQAGSAINLTCLITQSPEPPIFVFWYHNDRMINYDATHGDISLQKGEGDTATSKLYIWKAQIADSGNYTCCPSNANATTVTVHVLNGEKHAAVQNDASLLPVTSAVAFRGSYDVCPLLLLIFSLTVQRLHL